MNKKLILIIIGIFIILVAIVGGYYIINNKPTGTLVTNNSKNKSSKIITINQLTFSPNTVNINVGDTVTWQNNDSTTHHIVADNGSFDLGNQVTRQKVIFKFSKAGTFNYYCSIHPSMKGVVIVR